MVFKENEELSDLLENMRWVKNVVRDRLSLLAKELGKKKIEYL